MNYKYVVFCPYFGNFPNNFRLWLKSCSFNKNFKFIVFSDNKVDCVLPENVELYNLSFYEFKKKVQEKFDFKISLETPYKLCDYKPLYGFVFEELLGNCDYWGFCDMDLIFGDLKKFLPEEPYDKISNLGHFCLFKNTKLVRESFMLNSSSRINYKDILSSSVHFGFDEIGDYGINSILKENNFKIYPFELNVADVDCRSDDMTLVKFINDRFCFFKGKRIFSFKKGKIVEHLNRKNEVLNNEYAYIHFQKRKMNVLVDENVDSFIIAPHSFEKYTDINNKIITIYQKRKKLFNKVWFEFKIKALKNRFKRYIEIKSIILKKDDRRF